MASGRSRITVIPFGINNTVPNTNLTPIEARQRLGIQDGEKTILFFGRITPYKGLHHLIAACTQNLTQPDDYRLIIAGRPDRCEDYWNATRELIRADMRSGRVLLREEHIPDCETEMYFKAADVIVLPYRHVYQSGVLFLGYSFGLPVLAADVGSLKTILWKVERDLCLRRKIPQELAKCVEKYFAKRLIRKLGHAAPRDPGFCDSTAFVEPGRPDDRARVCRPISPSHTQRNEQAEQVFF